MRQNLKKKCYEVDVILRRTKTSKLSDCIFEVPHASFYLLVFVIRMIESRASSSACQNKFHIYQLPIFKNTRMNG